MIEDHIYCMKKRHVKTVSLFGLMEKYPAKESVIKYFEGLRWGKKINCTKCGSSKKITRQKKPYGRYWCKECRSYFTALTGTPLEYAEVDICRIFAYDFPKGNKQFTVEQGVRSNPDNSLVYAA